MTISRTPLLLAGLAALGFTSAALAQQQPSNPKLDFIKGKTEGILLYGTRPGSTPAAATTPAAPGAATAAPPPGYTPAPAGTWGAMPANATGTPQVATAATSSQPVLSRLGDMFNFREPPKGQSINQLKKSLDGDETGIPLPVGTPSRK